MNHYCKKVDTEITLYDVIFVAAIPHHPGFLSLAMKVCHNRSFKQLDAFT